MQRQTKLDEFPAFTEIVKSEAENQKRVREVYDRLKQKSICRQTNPD
jgi:hypothetical protein